MGLAQHTAQPHAVQPWGRQEVHPIYQTVRPPGKVYVDTGGHVLDDLGSSLLLLLEGNSILHQV